MMGAPINCSACGEENTQGDQFCGACGAALVEREPSRVQTCAGCGATVSADERFCGDCGTPVKATFLRRQASSQAGTPLTETPSAAARMGEQFQMRIDAIFAIAGLGTVVTGKIEQGIVTAKMRVEISGDGRRRTAVVVRVESFNKILKEGRAGENVALVLSGVDKNDLAPGLTVAVT
jgi:hypothetical protein